MSSDPQIDETLARVAAERLMADIQSGALEPGRKLRIVELKRQYGIGASPLREALQFVSSLGYATGESHRGYRVAALSREDLADITRAREVIEAGMLEASMAATNDEWEVSLLAAMEKLRRAVARAGEEGFYTSAAVTAAHKDLHAALVANCGSPRLINMQALLFDQARRYRVIMIAEVPSAERFVQTHQALVDVVLGKNVGEASSALRSHLNLTLRDVYKT